MCLILPVRSRRKDLYSKFVTKIKKCLWGNNKNEIKLYLNQYRKTALISGYLLMFVLIEINRNRFSWFIGYSSSLLLGSLLSFILENGLDFLETKKMN